MTAKKRVLWFHVLLIFILAVLSISKLDRRAEHDRGDHIAYYRAAVRLGAGADPYAPTGDQYLYLYPPLWAFLIQPLTWCGPRVFAVVWGSLIGILWISSLWLVARLVNRAVWWDWRVVILPSLLVLRPVMNSWGLGQVTILLVALTAAIIYCEQRGRPAAAGILVALAGWIKAFPFFLGLQLLVCRHAARALAWFALAAILLALLPAAQVGTSGVVTLFKDGFLGEAMRNLDLQRSWHGRCGPISMIWKMHGWTVGPAMKLTELLWGLFATALIVRLRPRKDEAPSSLWNSLLVTTMLVVTPLLGESYLALLFIPYTLSLAEIAEEKLSTTSRRTLLFGVTMCGFFMNASAPLLVGRGTSDRIEDLGTTTIGLLCFWIALVVVRSKERQECEERISSDNE